MKDMHDHLHVIEHDPLTGGKSVHGRGTNVVIFAQPRFDFARDCFQMRLRSPRADDEEIGKGRNLAQVEDQDALGFFIRGELRAGLR